MEMGKVMMKKKEIPLYKVGNCEIIVYWFGIKRLQYNII